MRDLSRVDREVLVLAFSRSRLSQIGLVAPADLSSILRKFGSLWKFFFSYKRRKKRESMSSPGPLPIGGQELDTPPEKIDKSLQKANKKLRGDIKQMEMKIKAMQVELTKSLQMKDRLEALCRELQKQNKYIKAESSAKIQEANARGKELASEVQNNMGFMKSINENLAAISSESLTVKRENDELAKKIGVLKGHYEEREQILQEALKDTNDSLTKARIELGEAKLENAQEKEKLISEMQKLADALLQSREQVKDSKLTELSLREMVQSYEDKFNGLQKALKDTNGSYEEFRTEMTKVTSRTKQLEKETTKWQQRWEESNIALNKMRENYNKVNEDLAKSQDSLEKMKGLCRTLHNENRDLQGELDGQKGGVTLSSSSSGGLSVNAAETLATINNEAATAAAAAQQKSQAGLTEENIAEESTTTHPKSPEEVKTTVVDTKNQEQGVDANGNAPELVAVAATPPKETFLAPQVPQQSPTSPGSSNPSTPTPGDGGDAASSKGKKNKKRKNNKK